LVVKKIVPLYILNTHPQNPEPALDSYPWLAVATLFYAKIKEKLTSPILGSILRSTIV
jgi:hypothetical protein